MDSVELISLCEDWVKKIYQNSEHLIRTGYWIRQLDEKASAEMIVAGITHDIERAFPEGRKPKGSSEDGAGVKWDDVVYNRWHGRRSADFVAEFLRQNGASDIFIQEVRRLVVSHEIGGDDNQDIIMDADSISFLEINPRMFINRIPQMYSTAQVKEKFDYMFNRISSDKAKKLAEPFYRNALRELTSADPV